MKSFKTVLSLAIFVLFTTVFYAWSVDAQVMSMDQLEDEAIDWIVDEG